MTKKELSRIYYLEKEIAMWERELEELDCMSLVSSGIGDGQPRGQKVPRSKVEDNVIKRMGIQAKMKELLEECEKSKAEIMDWIKSIDDSFIRQIIYYRCIKVMSWVAVADKIGGGNTADSVRKAYDRFTASYFPENPSVLSVRTVLL